MQVYNLDHCHETCTIVTNRSRNVATINYRCSLPPATLYYAFLLPMALIITHNLAVFAMVLKVILWPVTENMQQDNQGWLFKANCMPKHYNIYASSTHS